MGGAGAPCGMENPWSIRMWSMPRSVQQFSVAIATRKVGTRDVTMNDGPG